MELKCNQAFTLMNALSEELAKSLGELGIVREENLEVLVPWLEDTVRKQFISLCEVLEIDNIENDIN